MAAMTFDEQWDWVDQLIYDLATDAMLAAVEGITAARAHDLAAAGLAVLTTDPLGEGDLTVDVYRTPTHATVAVVRRADLLDDADTIQWEQRVTAAIDYAVSHATTRRLREDGSR